MGVTVSSSHVVSAAPCPSGEGLLTLYPCPLTGDSSTQTSPARVLPTGCSSARTAHSVRPSHRVQSFRNRLLQHGSPRGHKPCQQTCSSVGSSLNGSASPGRSLLQHGLPTGSQLLQASTCSSVRSLPWATGGYLLHRGPPWAAGGQPASPWSSSWAVGENSLLRHLEYLLPLLLHKLWCLQSCFCHIISVLSLDCRFAAGFFPLLRYVITEALPPSLMGLALASTRSILEPAGTGSTRHGGSFSQLLTEATPIAPLLPKPRHSNP